MTKYYLVVTSVVVSKKSKNVCPALIQSVLRRMKNSLCKREEMITVQFAGLKHAINLLVYKLVAAIFSILNAY